MISINRFWHSRFARQTGFLFGVDMIANAIDYGFHIFLGRSLSPGDFAVFQTTNAALLIMVASFGVLQPVLARQVAEIRAGRPEAPTLSTFSISLFRSYLGWSLLVGSLLAGLAAILRRPLGAWLNLPLAAVLLGALAILFILLRPVVTGTLQGAQRFIPFGAVRLVFAVGRFLLAALFIGLGRGLWGALASLPAGHFLAVTAGLVFIGPFVRRTSLKAERRWLVEGLKLSGAAFLAYAAHTTLLNLDLLWANHNFSPELAGAYATAVLLRRILLLLPGAATVILFPRVAVAVTRKQLPDRLLIWTVLLVSAAVTALILLYYAAGGLIVEFTFGSVYIQAGPLLGPMGLAILGFSLATIWLNVFLATKPWPFVILLSAVALLEGAFLFAWGQTMAGIVTSFSLAGWLLAGGGALLYVFWLRPSLMHDARFD